MRTHAEARERWNETLKHSGSLADLQRAVRYNGPLSPCVAGLRSLCWKTFLLFQDTSISKWVERLGQTRQEYANYSDQLLRFIKHPEELATVAVDPLADDPDSPWNAVRQDEITRAEIAQDVKRLPDEPFYHEERIQTMIVDALFVYCKLHPGEGGYRQGMHELLAPIVHVLHHDAVEQNSASSSSDDRTESNNTGGEAMLSVLDSSYIEHDAFTLFSKVMERARAFYEVGDSVSRSALESASRGVESTSAIVERSKLIHEVCLAKVDPELAGHLKDVEVLPQIFLIRWIRLLMSREFPFEQLLVLWDALFAVDPTLDLVDLVCVAMLIRIRWSLLEADYSVCLQLLLKYPPPDEHHGPHTFVDDAVYLKSHLNASGGASLIMKYTGKLPASSTSRPRLRPATPNRSSTQSQRLRIIHSPLSSPGSFIQQQGGVEAIFQGAAKNVLERGERLGINQAVRDAVGEIKRNVQGFNEARYHSPRTARQMLSDDSASRAMVALEKRNRLLAGMLGESIENLRSLTSSNLGDQAKMLELVEMAAARVQFVKVHLEDSSISVRDDDTGGEKGQGQDTVMEDPISADHNAVAEQTADSVSALQISNDGESKPSKTSSLPVVRSPDLMDTSDGPTTTAATESREQREDTQVPEAPLDTKESRPLLPIPTRSTLAQSSFSWMLEPDESIPHPHSSPSGQTTSASGHQSKPLHATTNRSKRMSGNASRDRNAFLFGEVTAESESESQPSTDDIFGMEPLSRRQREKKKGPLR